MKKIVIIIAAVLIIVFVSIVGFGMILTSRVKLPETVKIMESYILSKAAAKHCLQNEFESEEQKQKYLSNFQHVIIATLAEATKLNPDLPEKVVVGKLKLRQKENDHELRKALKFKGGCDNEKVKELLKMHSIFINMPHYSEWNKRGVK